MTSYSLERTAPLCCNALLLASTRNASYCNSNIQYCNRDCNRSYQYLLLLQTGQCNVAATSDRPLSQCGAACWLPPSRLLPRPSPRPRRRQCGGHRSLASACWNWKGWWVISSSDTCPSLAGFTSGSLIACSRPAPLVGHPTHLAPVPSSLLRARAAEHVAVAPAREMLRCVVCVRRLWPRTAA